MANARTINAINISRVLRHVWHFPRKSRSEIAEDLGLDKSTVTKIVASLEQMGLVVPREEGPSGPRGGRKPIYLGINPSFGMVLGFELHTTTYSAIALDFTGRELFYKEAALPKEDDIILITVRMIEETREDVRALGLPLAGIGIGLSGLVDPFEGVVHRSNPLDITSPTALVPPLETRFGLPVFIENDANCCCWADLLQTRGAREGNALFILSEFRQTSAHTVPQMGVGIGMAFLFHEGVFYGDHFIAGEFKSILWRPPNVTQFSIPDEEAARIPDPQVVRKVIVELGKHVAFLANTLDLSRIVVCGDLEAFEHEVKTIFMEEIQENWLYPEQTSPRIEMSPLKEKTVAYGAAGCFLERLFSVPEVVPGSRVLPSGLHLLELVLEHWQRGES
ncbi:ROK family transcriptional regulator [Spirochaeta thermophila]|uniref:Putative transcriptional repressor n=1 Tax=Winmispira thermophila (strain ATCC 49972 / DSM 6192 / RI 19.B1) TaxID=665571 RepID=E0RP03_WINT6|nr:ROK family transcriptional regulator [Spirochaeta thermophila]ADN02665.1 putative transcriptional repressor [Spirochaeta thermophila DSM 6192]